MSDTTFRPYEGNEPYIFISYARKDKGAVLPLIEAMARAGYRIWYDEGIHAGAHWTEVLIEQIRDCVVFLPFFSPAFDASRFCFEETEYAYRKDKTIVPVHLVPMEQDGLRPLFQFLMARQDLRAYQFDGPDAFAARLGQEAAFAPCKVDGETTDVGTAPGTGWHPIEGGTIHWRLDGDGVLTIARNEVFPAWMKATPIPDYEWDRERRMSTAPWMDLREEIRSVVIQDKIPAIGNLAFYGHRGLTSVTIPDSVTTIGVGAFKYCASLTSVTIGDSVTTIGDEVFQGCTGLTSVMIPDSVTTIGNWAFHGCAGLTSVTIGRRVTSIGRYAFYDCAGLTSVTIPDSVTSIGQQAFRGCAGLTSVTIPDSVIFIGDQAFEGCASLTKVEIPAGARFRESGSWASFPDHVQVIRRPPRRE